MKIHRVRGHSQDELRLRLRGRSDRPGVADGTVQADQGDPVHAPLGEADWCVAPFLLEEAARRIIASVVVRFRQPLRHAGKQFRRPGGMGLPGP